jgi:hypothetical protein
MLRFLLILIACATAGRAQERTLEVRTLAMTSGDMPELLLRTAGEPAILEWSHRQPGQGLTVLHANPLPLYRREVNEDGKEKLVAVTKVALPANVRGVLLLGWTSDGKTRCVAIDDHLATAQFNDWLLINAATRPVAFGVGDTNKPAIVKPGDSVRYRVPAQRGKGATVRAQLPVEGGRAKTFYSTFWPIYPDKRALVIFVDDGDKVRVKRISDKLLPAGDAGDDS